MGEKLFCRVNIILIGLTQDRKVDERGKRVIKG